MQIMQSSSIKMGLFYIQEHKNDALQEKQNNYLEKGKRLILKR